MKRLTQLLLIVASIALFISIFVPIWRIDLDAPQYPEGLGLLIYSNKLAGDVDIINGLNHYIGMKTLHADDFVEFTVLPYIIGFYALFTLLVAILKNKRLLQILFVLFVAFGVIAMIDFWRWEYDYGHNLNPNAAIIVPGMAYQPPLIGFKQLLNFGAYSVPAIGGILFILAGILMLVSVWMERKNNSYTKKISLGLLFLFGVGLNSCTDINLPVAIKYNADACDYCKMTILDNKFAAEFKTNKGRAFKFDDLQCMLGYIGEGNEYAKDASHYFVCDFSSNSLIPVDKSTIIYSESISSPMGGGMACFSNIDSATKYKEIYQANSLTWLELLNQK